MMKKYYMIFKNNLSMTLAYKWNVLASFLIQLIPLFTSIFIWNGVYDSGGGPALYSKDEMILYLILTVIISTIFTAGPAFRLAGMIRNGTLSSLLIKPISIRKENFFGSLGKNVLKIIIVLISLLICTVSRIIEVPNALIGLLLLGLSYIMYFNLLSCISLLGFWLIQMWPLRVIYNAVYMFFGGLVFPLSLLGKKLFTLIKYNPFSLVGYFITETFLARVGIVEIYFCLLANLIWILFFRLVYSLGWKHALKKYEGMGA